MAQRELNCRKLFGVHFLVVILFISFSYFLFVYEYLLLLRPSYFAVGMVVFHIIFFLLLWSMIRSICSDPGRVPIYWGFFLDEKETKKRRYCLLCHSFKPQRQLAPYSRCHHCSTCQRCVLNMDHHCPWISNCVGFSNRKFFMLFLFYICLTTLAAMGFMTPMVVQEVIRAVHEPKYLLSGHVLTRLIGFLLLSTFGVIIGMFFKFHVELVLRNTSTLENLDKQRNLEQSQSKNVFDLGDYENWVQVFGSNAMLWPLPIFGESGKPRGDGVQWRKNDGST